MRPCRLEYRPNYPGGRWYVLRRRWWGWKTLTYCRTEGEARTAADRALAARRNRQWWIARLKIRYRQWCAARRSTPTLAETEELITRLPERTRIVFTLFKVYRKSSAQIAVRLGITETTVHQELIAATRAIAPREQGMHS